MIWAMAKKSVSKKRVVEQLLSLGVRQGGLLLVHASFRETGPVEGGPAGLVDALRAAVGRTGTLVMPSMSDDDDHPFDVKGTPCVGMGVVADTFWRMPGVLRSDSPHAFAAAGSDAEMIVAPHPIDPPHGLDSPVGRVYEMGGQVLLLGVGHDANTTVHLAENLAGVRYRRPKYVTMLDGGQPVRLEYAEIDHCCQRFALLDSWLRERALQVEGKVGHAASRLMRSRDVVEAAVPRLQAEETVFLHEPGVDAECDEAWASLPA
jgi:aminoglycoside 3-N-acetyltransferase